MIRFMTWLVVLSAALVAVPAFAAKGDGDAAKGKELFDTKCAICHNADSKDKKIGPGLQGVKDGKLPSGKDTTYENLLKNLNEGGGGMPAFDKLITSEEKDHVIAYVMTL
jgi:mono/diheme cytochrome c family protein